VKGRAGEEMSEGSEEKAGARGPENEAPERETDPKDRGRAATGAGRPGPRPENVRGTRKGKLCRAKRVRLFPPDPSGEPWTASS